MEREAKRSVGRPKKVQAGARRMTRSKSIFSEIIDLSEDIQKVPRKRVARSKSIYSRSEVINISEDVDEIPRKRMTRAKSVYSRDTKPEVDVFERASIYEGVERMIIDEGPKEMENIIALTDSMRLSDSKLVHFKANTEMECWILSADFDQSDSIRFPISHGQQCMAISCAAICHLKSKSQLIYSENGHTINWSTKDLNYILEKGDRLYCISQEDCPPSNLLTFDEVYKYIEINDRIYHFKSNEEIDAEGNLKFEFQAQCTFVNVVLGIEKFDGNVNAAIFTCNGYSFSIHFV